MIDVLTTDKEWITWRKEHAASYANLPAPATFPVVVVPSSYDHSWQVVAVRFIHSTDLERILKQLCQ